GSVHRALRRKLKLLRVDGFDDAGLPRLAFQQQEQESLLGAGGKRGRGTRDEGRGRTTLPPSPVPRHLSLQHILANAGGFRGARDVQLPGDGILRRADRREQPVERPAPAREAREEGLAVENLDLTLQGVDRVLEDGFQSRGALLLDERIRVLSRRKRG